MSFYSTADQNNNALAEGTDEAEKVEESLRDFISKIISYYEKFGMTNEVLSKFEEKISSSETLLEVFEVMKEMVEELMKQIGQSNGFAN